MTGNAHHQIGLGRVGLVHQHVLLFQGGAAVEDDGKGFAGRDVDEGRDIRSCRVDIGSQVEQDVAGASPLHAEVVGDDPHLEDDRQPVAVQHLHR